MTFYLKYRPQTIGDLDIDSVKESILNILKLKNIPHAFLFSGPKGTGKTSTARILAKILNCDLGDGSSEPCNKCEQCTAVSNGTNVDVIEIDAASNRGIDDIRILRESVKLSPLRAKKKVYIIDEAHMLTPEASNALLKILEEPPRHACFILATTNPEKIIDTLKSRTFQINFNKAADNEIKRSLEKVIANEKIKIKNEELLLIIEMANGSFRDASKFLEAFSKNPKMLKKLIAFDEKHFADLIFEKKINEILVYLNKAIESGCKVEDIIERLIRQIRSRMLNQKDISTIHLIELLINSRELQKFSPIEELPLEMAIIKWCKMG